MFSSKAPIFSFCRLCALYFLCNYPLFYVILRYVTHRSRSEFCKRGIQELEIRIRENSVCRNENSSVFHLFRSDQISFILNQLYASFLIALFLIFSFLRASFIHDRIIQHLLYSLIIFLLNHALILLLLAMCLFRLKLELSGTFIYIIYEILIFDIFFKILFLLFFLDFYFIFIFNFYIILNFLFFFFK